MTRRLATITLTAGMLLAGMTEAITHGQQPAAPAMAPALASLWPQTLSFYRQQLTQHGIVGSSLLVIKDGQIAAQDVEGFQDHDKKTPVDDQTIFHWASITKTFTGIAI